MSCERDKYLVIRAANPADLPDVFALERESPLAAHWSESQYLQAFSGDSPRRLILVAADEELKKAQHQAQQQSLKPEPSTEPKTKIVGFVVVRILAQEWEIENIVVDAKQQRRGIATKLLDEIRRLAESENAMKIFLEVRASNLLARAFYEKIGFQGCGYRRRYYSGPAEDAAMYLYTLQHVAKKV